MVSFHVQSEDLVPPIQSLENYFREGGTSIIQAAFQHTYFVHPDAVRNRTPYFPGQSEMQPGTLPRNRHRATDHMGRLETEGTLSWTTTRGPKWPGGGTAGTN